MLFPPDNDSHSLSTFFVRTILSKRFRRDDFVNPYDPPIGIFYGIMLPRNTPFRSTSQELYHIMMKKSICFISVLHKTAINLSIVSSAIFPQIVFSQKTSSEERKRISKHGARRPFLLRLPDRLHKEPGKAERRNIA